MSKYLKTTLVVLIILISVIFCSCSDQNNRVNNDTDAPESADDSAFDNEQKNDTESNSANKSETKETLPAKPLDGVTIVLDPGHGKFSENYQEPIAPGSSETKPAYSTGTAGAFISEAEFNLIIARKIAPLLESNGASVYFTRSDENSVSNVERAVYANELNADLAVRIHADGSTNVSLYGISVLVPGDGVIEQKTVADSRAAGEAVLGALISATDANNRGIIERYDLTGFNWSSVPVILVECGFMSNPDEDALLANELYQDRIASGIAQGIADYFKND